ncbi:MAG: hypothetical protein IT446_03410 [Phycisphaerales bacterium]|nr:hypothetical protein [Phycisphaerales bacterium]
MTLPPALTWAYLFAPRAAFDCKQGPAWLNQAIADQPGDAGDPIPVICGRELNQLPDLSAAPGLVAINCPKLTESSIRQLGFEYVRRFAVIPSFKHARWFIPLDNAAVASDGFALYKPSKPLSRFKHAAARIAARIHLPGWYHDQVCIAQRKAPELFTILSGLFDGRPFRMAISAGAPEPSRNRKPSIMIFDPQGQVLGFAKLAREPSVRALLEHESRLLKALAEVNADAPRLLYFGEVQGSLLMVQSPLHGRSSKVKLSEAHLNFLASLQRPQRKIASQTAMVGELPSRLNRLTVPHEDLDQALADVLPMLERMDIPSTIVHGDFGPWNLRANEGRIFAYDWEYGQVDGLPLIDQFHHLLFCGYLFYRWDSRQGFRHLLEMAASQPQGFTPRQARTLATVYLLDMLARLLGEDYDPADPMVIWFRDLLAQLAPMGRWPEMEQQSPSRELQNSGVGS